MGRCLYRTARGAHQANLSAAAPAPMLDVPFSLWLHLSHHVERSGALISVAELSYLPKVLERYVSPSALDGLQPVIARGSGGTLRPTTEADTAPDSAIDFGAALLGPIMLAFSAVAPPLCALALNTREVEIGIDGMPKVAGELFECDVVTSFDERGGSRVRYAMVSLSDITHTSPEVVYGAFFDELGWEFDAPTTSARSLTLETENADGLTALLESVRTLDAELGR